MATWLIAMEAGAGFEPTSCTCAGCCTSACASPTVSPPPVAGDFPSVWELLCVRFRKVPDILCRIAQES